MYESMVEYEYVLASYRSLGALTFNEQQVVDISTIAPQRSSKPQDGLSILYFTIHVE